MSTKSSRSRRAAIWTVALGCALLAGGGGATANGGALALPSGRALDELRERAQAVADEVTSLELRLQDLRAQGVRIDNAIEAASRDIGVLELELARAEAALDAATKGYVGRAVEVYKRGAGGDLAILLSATDIAELETLARAASARAEAGVRSLERLKRSQEDLSTTQARLEERKRALMDDKAAAAEVGVRMEAVLTTRRATLRELTSRVEELEIEVARAAARRTAQREAELREAELREAELREAELREAELREAELGEAELREAELGEAEQRGSEGGASGGTPTGAAAEGPEAPGARSIGTGVTFEGIASWYGPGFEGNLTASGDVFHRAGHTAASRDLPLGTWLRVSFEGRGVIVLVNDRGPYIEERILDLSEGAAQQIGLTGLGWIQAEIVLPR